MTVPCLLLVVLAFVLAWPMTWIMRAAGRRAGHLDHPGERKLHAQPVPVTGGVAIFAAVAGPLLGAVLAAWVVPVAWWEAVLPSAVKHLPGMRNTTPLALTLLGALAALHGVGLIDDRKALGPWPKLGVQLLAALALSVFFDVRLLSLLGVVPSVLLTVLWLVTITNAFNFLDNMDGLSAGVGAICAAILLAAALLSGQWFVAGLVALLVGALAGFLCFNFPPASIFMGDGGSLVVGFLLGFCAIRVTYFDPSMGTRWWAIGTPLVVLAIPLYDLVSVTLIRIGQGRSPLVGDTQHFSHRLVRKGLSRRAAVIVIWAAAAATGLGGVMLGRLAGWQAALVVAQTGLILLVLALLEQAGREPPMNSDGIW